MVNLAKPAHVFDRDREWAGLAGFVTARTTDTGATLGVVSGRRRQGKSYLLQALTEATNGLYFAATEATEAESLRLLTAALSRFLHEAIEPMADWNAALATLLRACRGRSVPLVIDEFPFLVRSTPALPSIVQRELGPGGSGRDSAARLILCGSAMSVMGGLLSGQAPLRGRAGLELVIRPFRHRDAAMFWGISDPRLAVLVNAVVGGTPAYGREFVQGDRPSDLADFDEWVVRTVLNPQTPLFREARYLLAEESDIRDPGLYHSVLAAIAAGHTTNGKIANYIGRRSDQITHPLAVLEDSALISREPDLLRTGRHRYRIVEPLITFYEAIMRRRWPELEIDRAAAVWSSTRHSFDAQVVGPHFETLCREFAVEAGADLFGDFPSEVGSGVVNDPAARDQIEVDVVVLAPPEASGPRRVLSLGEAKWNEVMGQHHVQRLARAADLLAAKGYDTSNTVLACYGAAGFNRELVSASAGDPRIALVDLDRLYG